MKKIIQKIKNLNNATKIALVAILVIALFCSTLGQNYTKRVFYGYKVKNAYTKEFSKLNGPMTQLGFSSTKSPDSTCEFEEIYGYEGLRLLCVATAQKYTVIGDETNDKEAFIRSAKELDSLLAQNGWTTFSNSANSFEDWFEGAVNGVDYNTDITAQKDFGSERCGISITVAYSNPVPPAINTVLTCNSPAYGIPNDGVLWLGGPEV